MWVSHVTGSRRLNCYKTSFIKEWWESGDHTTLITRPGSFGKTLNMSMMEYFFSVKHEGRGDLFEGLSIWKEEKYMALIERGLEDRKEKVKEWYNGFMIGSHGDIYNPWSILNRCEDE